MNRAHTLVQTQEKTIHPVKEFRTAASLHGHTRFSKESLEFLPHYVDFLRTNFVSRVFQSGLDRYYRINGKSLDFHHAYWTPPVTPGMVLASEKEQIEDKLNLAALVSITDHDTIEAPMSLREHPDSADLPVSVEWTVPMGRNSFHIGVHHLPPENSAEIMEELSAYTGEPEEARLRDLLAYLHEFPDTLLILNHPLQDIVRAGAANHLDSLRHFMARCRPWIHGLEWNGMRAERENRDVLLLAEEYDLPVVAGGDRHGRRPTTVVNLCHAGIWNEFVAEIRNDRQTTVLLLPAYEEPAPLRELATAAEVVRRYPRYPYGQRRFTDRIFFNLEGYGTHPLSFYWDGGRGMPLWLSPVIFTLIALGSDRVRPVLRLFLSRSAQFDNAELSQKVQSADESGVRAEVSIEQE